MARVALIQSGFTAGELSPRMLSRTDLKGYGEGAQIMRNVIPVSQGPALSRGGTYHTLRIQDAQSARLIPFPIRPDEAYMLVFYKSKLVVLQESGLPARGNLLVNGRFQQLGTGWTVYTGTGGNQGIVTFALGTATLDSKLTNPAAVRQSFTTVSGHTYTVAVVAFSRNGATINIGTAAGGTELATQSMGSKAVDQLVFTATGTTTWIEVTQPAGAALDSIISSVGVVDNEVTTPFVELTSPYTESMLKDIHYEIQPAGNVIYLFHPLVTPQRITYTAPGTFALEAIVFTSPPTAWATDNYPGAGTFSNGRLWLAGCPLNPSSIWGSKSGAYDNFTIGTQADDAIALSIAKAGTIRWLKGVKSLLVGTDNTEFVISSKDGVITPSDITIELQSAYGSVSHLPVSIGNQVLYLGADGRKLRAMGYRFEEAGWVSTDLTFPSEHITEGKAVQLAWAQNPDQVIWIVDIAGNLLGCTYDRPNSLIGWHRHDLKDGKVRAVAALRFIGIDFVWLAVQYVIGGVNEIHIQIMSTLGDDTIFTDNTKRFDFSTPGTVVTGLGHLEGMTVQVLGDGSVQPDEVVAGGQITLTQPVSVALIGLQMRRQLKPMPFEAAGNPNATEPAVKRFNKIYVRTFNTLRPIINGVRPATRHPATPMDAPEPWASEDIQVMNLGWGRRAEILIEEDLPIPFAVISIFGEMGVSA